MYVNLDCKLLARASVCYQVATVHYLTTFLHNGIRREAVYRCEALRA
jgi:hypothetical protein